MRKSPAQALLQSSAASGPVSGVERIKRAAALAAHRTLGRRVFHLLKAAVRTFRTDFCRRWIGHCMLAETFLLRAHSECRLDRLVGPHNFRARCSFCGTAPVVTSDFPIKVAPSSITRRAALRSPCNTHLRFQLAALANGDIAVHFAIDADRFGFDLAANLSVFTDRQNAVRVDVAFDFAVDEQFFLKLDRAFDFDIARKDVFASVICHRIRFLDLDYRLWLVLLVPLRDSQNDFHHLEPDSAVLLESGAPAFAGRIF